MEDIIMAKRGGFPGGAMQRTQMPMAPINRKRSYAANEAATKSPYDSTCVHPSSVFCEKNGTISQLLLQQLRHRQCLRRYQYNGCFLFHSAFNISIGLWASTTSRMRSVTWRPT